MKCCFWGDLLLELIVVCTQHHNCHVRMAIGWHHYSIPILISLTGLNTSLVPMYISEIAPLNLRGGLGTINQLAVTSITNNKCACGWGRNSPTDLRIQLLVSLTLFHFFLDRCQCDEVHHFRIDREGWNGRTSHAQAQDRDWKWTRQRCRCLSGSYFV